MFPGRQNWIWPALARRASSGLLTLTGFGRYTNIRAFVAQMLLMDKSPT
jgi:hypothetical protein